MEPVQKNKYVGATGTGAEKDMGKDLGKDLGKDREKNAMPDGTCDLPGLSVAGITATKAPAKQAKDKAKDKERLGQLSSSLKQAYQTTLDEAVPDSMMDLLKKLG